MRHKTAGKRSQLGSVRRLPSGRYQARYRAGAETYKAPKTFETKQEANNWLAGEFADRARGTWVDPKGNPLGQYARQWLASRIDLTNSTRQRYQGALNNYILADFDGFSLAYMPIGQITTQIIRRWLALVADKAKQTAIANKGGKPITVQQPTQHPARIWGRANGWQVKDEGKLPKGLLQAWAKACPKQSANYKPTKSKGKDKTGHSNQIRAWGMANGWNISETGRLPEGLIAAWYQHQAQEEETINGARQTNPGQATTAKAYATLRAIFNSAVTDGLLHYNPCRLPGAGQSKAIERTPATPQQIQQLAALMPQDLASAVVVAAWSGLRQGELFGLARKHVNLETGALKVERTLTRQREFSLPKTQSSIRTVYLPKFVTEVLAQHMSKYTSNEPDALIWHSYTGAPIRLARVNQHFHKARAAIGRPDLRWHDLRHTGATLAYQAGGNVKDVQRRLGHATARAAMIYAHAADNGDKLLAQRLDEAFNPNNVPTTPTTPPQPASAEQHLAPIIRPRFRVIQGRKASA